MMVGFVVGVGSGRNNGSPKGPRDEITKWTKTFGIGRGFSVQQTVDGGFVVTGIDGDENLFYSRQLVKEISNNFDE